jgi:hypothetical protein
MYEQIRTRSVHTVADAPAGFPHRSREEELDIQLAGHLSGLLAVTDELRALAPDAELDVLADRLAAQVCRLRGGKDAVRITPAVPASAGSDDKVTALHRRAHALDGRALVVAASRADTAAAILAAQCMDLHAAAVAVECVPAGD